MITMEAGPLEFHDKIPLKSRYAHLGVRVVPHAVARHGSYLAPGVILMPSYVNIGAYVDEGTMVGTWATVGSCAQNSGKACSLSGGVGIGGVLVTCPGTGRDSLKMAASSARGPSWWRVFASARSGARSKCGADRQHQDYSTRPAPNRRRCVVRAPRSVVICNILQIRN